MTTTRPEQLSHRQIRRPQIARPRSPSRADDRHHRQNVGTFERVAGGALGVALVKFGFGRRSLLGLGLAGLGGMMVYRSATGHCPAYEKLGIDTAGKSAAQPEEFFQRGVHVEQSFHVNKPASEVYHFWRDFSRLPTFMKHLENVEVLSETRSRWTATGPMGTHISWEAEIIHDVPHERIAWKSVEHSSVANAGTVTFLPRGEGAAEVRVVLDYIPPAGSVGKVIAQLFGAEPSQTIKEDLRRFKQVMEAGEAATVEGQSRGRC